MADVSGSAGINYPEWTDYRRKNGLDPLGMKNNSDPLLREAAGTRGRRLPLSAGERTARNAVIVSAGGRRVS